MKELLSCSLYPPSRDVIGLHPGRQIEVKKFSSCWLEIGSNLRQRVEVSIGERPLVYMQSSPCLSSQGFNGFCSAWKLPKNPTQ